MSERKVLNKYYPPDFDPSKIPKLRQAKNKQYTIRTMAPFNMRCNTCADYIYKGRKFNAKCEVAEGEDFLGLRIYRFYIRCPKCISEIMFKTDPENTDYTLEHGATRLFEAAKLIEEAEKEEQRQREEDATNPMKMLETRTKDSKLEMEIMENLEELREQNTRKEEVDYTELLRRKAEEEEERRLQEEKEDEDEIRRIFGKTGKGSLKRLQDDDEDDEEEAEKTKPKEKYKRPSDCLVEGTPPRKKSNSTFSGKAAISSLIKRKTTVSSDLGPPQTSEHFNLVSNYKGDTSKGENSNTALKLHPADPQGSALASVNGLTKENGEKDQEEDGDTSNVEEKTEINFVNSIKEGLSKNSEKLAKKEEVRGGSFGLLVGYDESDSDTSSNDG